MKYLKSFILVAVALFAVNSVVFADPAAYRERMTLEFYASKYISLDKPIDRIFVGSSEIITVRQTDDSRSEFVITAKSKKGSTTLFIWTSDGERREYLVNVVEEEIGRAEIIEEAIGLPDVHVKKIGSKILLTGTVKNQYERNLAIQTASLYVENTGNNNNISVGSNVNMDLSTDNATSSGSSDIELNKVETSGAIIDLLTMLNPTQIRLEAQVVEINSDKARDLGVQYGYNYTGGVFRFGESHTREKTTTNYYFYTDSNGHPQMGSYSYNNNNTPFRKNPGKWLEEHFSPINAQINALVNNGKARILSRPNVTTMSGESAKIRIGGEIPYSTVSDNGTNVSFKDYGIILQFKPVVDAEGRIISAVHTEVSSLSGESVDGQPILNTRSADSVVNLNPGSTMVIGGLMDSSESKRVQKIPLLGDIPILGEFFKYTSKSRDRRELIVLITPYVVEDQDASRAGMSEEMRDWYYDEQRAHNNLYDVDTNELPPPFEEDKKDSKKDRKDKKDSKKDKKDQSSKQRDSKTERAKKTSNNDVPNDPKNSNVEVFGDEF